MSVYPIKPLSPDTWTISQSSPNAPCPQGAACLIAQAGGGVVGTYPQDTDGQQVSASFLYNATRSLFDEAGFSYDRRKGKYHRVMSKTITPS